MERKLRNRKRRASKGKAIRISNLVYETLNKARFRRSWDCLLRRMLGLEDRAGNPQVLIEGVLETTTGVLLLKTPETSWSLLEERAYEMAIRAAARKKEKRVSRPIRMRELA